MVKERKPQRGGKKPVNQTQLGKTLGVTQQRVSQLIKREGWRWGRGPWAWDVVSEIKAWLGGLRDENNATAGESSSNPLSMDGSLEDQLKLMTPRKRAEYDLLVKRTAKVEIENTLALGGYLKREDVERGRVERIEAVRSELANIRLLAIKLNGKDVPAMELVLENWARDLCVKFERS